MTHAGDDNPETGRSDALGDEEKKMRRLRIIVDLTAAVLAQEKLTVDEALDLVNATRRTVLHLFPGKERTYDLIYAKRFARIMRERFGVGERREQDDDP
jgi:predicted deacetylase